MANIEILKRNREILIKIGVERDKKLSENDFELVKDAKGISQ